jgi:hypothetical protein
VEHFEYPPKNVFVFGPDKSNITTAQPGARGTEMTCLFVRHFGSGIVIGSDTREFEPATETWHDGCQKLATTDYGFFAASGAKDLIAGTLAYFVETPRILSSCGLEGIANDVLWRPENIDLLFRLVNSVRPDFDELGYESRPVVVVTLVIGNKDRACSPKVRALVLDFRQRSFELLDGTQDRERRVVLPGDLSPDDALSIANRLYTRFDKELSSSGVADEDAYGEHQPSGVLQSATANVRAVSAVLDQMSRLSRFVSEDHHVGVHLASAPLELPFVHGSWSQLRSSRVRNDSSKGLVLECEGHRQEGVVRPG